MTDTSRWSDPSKTRIHGAAAPEHCVCVMGPGRSGTTWLGQMLNHYPRAMYKYEPFLQSKDTPYRDWRDALGREEPAQMREQFYALCSQCFLEVDMPSSVPKYFRRQNGMLLRLLHALGKKFPICKGLYETYGRTPVERAESILIKDVNFPNQRLPHLFAALHPHLIGLVRNPFSTIASFRQGVQFGMFQNDRSMVVRSIATQLQDDDGCGHLRHYSESLDQMTLLQLEALRWRIQVEPLVHFVRNCDQGLLVVYEDLCIDPHGKINEIFSFLRWPVPASLHDFINASTQGEKVRLNRQKSYYSVYRNPRASLSKWKQDLSASQQQEIATVFSESPLRDLWPDLPVK